MEQEKLFIQIFQKKACGLNMKNCQKIFRTELHVHILYTQLMHPILLRHLE